ncbi:MAG: hypothetical protein ACI9IP_002386 [Arcticibacterium sp.]|jgi:hypothetical protein
MFKINLALLYYAAKITLCSCTPEKVKGFEKIRDRSTITKIATLPEVVNESSGLSMADSSTFWTHNDSGGDNALYMVNKRGQLIDSLLVHHHINIDWEDLAKDDSGNLYIGDFGNNQNTRKDLAIIKIKDGKSEEIKFSYSHQSAFPPKKREFDSEAFFHFNGQLHLFTKSWEKKNLVTKHYTIPDIAGTYALTPKNILALNEPVTSADISPDKKTFVLLTYGKILLFRIENKEIDFSTPLACLKTRRKQTEAIAFDGNNKLLMTNEQGELFEIIL